MDNEIELDETNIQKLLDWAYEKSIKGLPQMLSAKELAKSHLKKHDSAEQAIKSLVRHQNTKAATLGFLAGLGGVITLPVAVPANLATVLYVQIRMVAAIAYLRGFDVNDNEVKTLVFVALTGKSAEKILKGTGIKIGKKMVGKQIFEQTVSKNVTVEALEKINQKVGFRLVTKFGQKGLINLGKLVPVVGGIIGGSHDLVSTHIIGKVAKNKLFIKET